MALVVLILGLYHRQRIRESIKPMLVGFQKSMQYRSINSDEKQEVAAAAAAASEQIIKNGVPIPAEAHV